MTIRVNILILRDAEAEQAVITNAPLQLTLRTLGGDTLWMLLVQNISPVPMKLLQSDDGTDTGVPSTSTELLWLSCKNNVSEVLNPTISWETIDPSTLESPSACAEQLARMAEQLDDVRS